MRKALFFLAITCTLLIACTCCKRSEKLEVPVRASVMYNQDSLNYYAALAYKDDDPRGLFITAAAYYLRRQGELPDTLSVVPRDEAEIMLLRSAQLGYQPARDLIHCLNDNGSWHHDVPDENK